MKVLLTQISLFSCLFFYVDIKMAIAQHYSSKNDTLNKIDTLLLKHSKSSLEKENEVNTTGNYIVVSSLRIKLLEPLGRDISDTTKEDFNFIKRLGNKTHIITKEKVIQQLLLFSENDTVTELHIMESERLLRRSLKIRDARIIVTPTQNNKYDVLVIVQDQIAINAGVSKIDNITSYSLVNRNILGYGISGGYAASFDKSGYVFSSIYYKDASIQNSYIEFESSYSSAKDNYINEIGLNRTFVTGLFDWAGGINYANVNSDRYFFNEDTIVSNYNSNMFKTDAWIGKAFDLNSGTKARKSFIVTSRYLNINENIIKKDTIPLENEPPIYNRSSNKILFSAGVTYRRYYKDSYIFRFLYSEDIPEGIKANLIFGKSFNQKYNDNYYLGISGGWANNFKIGYFNFNYELTKLISKNKILNDYLGSVGLLYLSPAIIDNNFKNRIFVSSRLQRVGNDIYFDRIYLDDDDGFLNVNSNVLSGLTKTSLIVNNILYTPYKPLGFNIGIFAYIAFANLGDANNMFAKDNWYQAYGLGFLLRNENLVINSIRVSFTFYPTFPDNTFKVNPIWIYDLNIPGLEINKPEVDN